MPTVHRFDGLRVVIYPNDHRPAHVHVKGAGGESYGFKLSEVRRIERALVAVLVTLCEEWRSIHARY
jgi:Domain of unknown function (DUF4160)